MRRALDHTAERSAIIFSLLASFCSRRLGSGTGLARARLLLEHSLDDTDSDRLSHVSDSKTTERRVFSERLDAHRLRRDQTNHGSVTRLNILGQLLELLAGSTIDLGQDFGELACNVGSVAVQHGCVAVVDLAGVVEHDNLGVERLALECRVVLGVGRDEASSDILDGNVLNVEANIVSGNSLRERFVVHFHRLDFSGHTGRGKDDDHARLEDTRFNTTDGHCADTANLVNVLKREAQRLLAGALGGSKVVK